MDLAAVEREMARLDAIYRPLCETPIDVSTAQTLVNSIADAAAFIETESQRLCLDERVGRVLRVVVECYSTGDEDVRAEIRRLFGRYTSFRWGAHLPRGDHLTREAFRADLILLSARDQGADTRDEILNLRAMCRKAREDGFDPDPILGEIAAISSDVDRYGMGSMRDIILAGRAP